MITSCGYHLTGTENTLSPDIHSIAVEVFANRTAEPMLGSWFADDLLYEFTRSKRLAVAPEKDADVVLTGTVVEIETRTIAHTADVASAERRVTVKLDVRLARTVNGKVIWRDRSFTEKEEFVVCESDRLKTAANRKAAIRRISERAAEKIHNRIFENF